MRGLCAVCVAVYIHCKPFSVCISVGTVQAPPCRQAGEKSWLMQKMPLAAPKKYGGWDGPGIPGLKGY